MAADDLSVRAPGWQVTTTPPKIDRRFGFNSYAETREFLNKLADISKQEGYYPDLSFGKTHVHVTINARDEKSLSDADFAFAVRAAALVKE